MPGEDQEIIAKLTELKKNLEKIKSKRDSINGAIKEKLIQKERAIAELKKLGVDNPDNLDVEIKRRQDEILALIELAQEEITKAERLLNENS